MSENQYAQRWGLLANDGLPSEKKPAARGLFADGVRNLLQGVSNSAASTVSAPVDGLAWLLRKAGLQSVVGDAPVGGSDWMAQAGLTAPAKGLAGLAGESVGNVLPILASAGAAPIAKSLLQMGANYAAVPGAAAGGRAAQRGAIDVFHGSPHSFDAFDMSKIGTGEGAQAYGHGLYFAESPEVAGAYQKALSAGKVTPPAAVNASEAAILETANFRAQQIGGDVAQGLQYMERNSADPERAAIIRGLLARTKKDGGAMYETRLAWPDAAREATDPLGPQHFLQWDKALSEQPANVQQAWDKFLSSPAGRRADASNWGALVRGEGQFGNPTGQDIHGAMHEGGILSGKPQPSAEVYAKVAEQLRKQGIPGIRYLDGGSRGAGQGTANYVVFDDNIPKITGRR